jgi:UDP-glucose 4-epimerase
MKVLVTGGAGFIGSHLCDRLLDRDHEVVCVDDLSKGRVENIQGAVERSGFSFEHLDVRDTDRLLDVGQGIEAVIHLAAFKIPRYESAFRVLSVNYEAGLATLELARANGAKFVLASTSDVYGKNPNLPFREDSELVLGSSTSRRWAYAISKLTDEQLAFAYQEDHGIPVVALRFFGSYGERQYLDWWGGPQGVFLNAIAHDKPIELHGGGLQTRCFVHVSDLVEGVARALEVPLAEGEIINLGTTEEISIAALGELMFELSGKSGGPQFEVIPYESLARNYEDPQRRIPDISKMERVLGLTPRVSLRDGITRLWEWYWRLPEVVRSTGTAD